MRSLVPTCVVLIFCFSAGASMAASGKSVTASGAGTLATASGVEGFRDGSGWHLSSPEFQVSISDDNGSLSNLTSRLPAEFDISPSSSGGLQVYVESGEHKRTAYMDRLVGGKMKKEADGISVVCSLSSSDEALAKTAVAEVTYSLGRDKLGIRVKITFLREDRTPYRMGVGIRYSPKEWDRHFYAMNYGDTRIYKMGEGITANYMDSLDDILQVEDRLAQPWGKDREGAYRADIALALPYGVMEREDRYVLWGCLDLGKFVVLVPNDRDMMPAFMMYPKEIRAGMEKEFDFFLKVFPKPENTFTEVLRWYAMNVESSDPLTKDIVRMPKDLKPRTFIQEGVLGQREAKNLWQTCDVAARWSDCTLPVESEWESVVTFKMTNPRTEKQKIEQFQKEGKKVHLYFCQLYLTPFLNEDPHATYGKDKSKPIPESWMIHNKYGHLVLWAGDPSHIKLSPQQKEHVKRCYGLEVDAMGRAFADFNNDEFRHWYVEEFVKKTIDYYQPDGIAWDMGWGDLFTGASQGSPKQGGINHGMLRVKHDVYSWLREKYPDKRVITNCHFGTPDMLYCDAVMHEGGLADHKAPEELELEAQKDRAYMNVPISYMYRIKPIELLIDTALGFSIAPLEGAGDYWETRVDVVKFAGKTYVTPLVSESRAIHTEPAKDFKTIIASVWADKSRLMAAVFNGKEEDTEITIRFDKEILENYGYVSEKDYKFTVAGPDAYKTEVGNLNKVAPCTVKGTLKSKHMLMIEG